MSRRSMASRASAVKRKRAIVEHDDQLQRRARLDFCLTIAVDPASGKRGHNGSFLLREVD